MVFDTMIFNNGSSFSICFSIGVGIALSYRYYGYIKKTRTKTSSYSVGNFIHQFNDMTRQERQETIGYGLYGDSFLSDCIFEAITQNRLDIVKKLVDLNGSRFIRFSANDYGQNMLIVAARYSNIKMLQYLLSNDWIINRINHQDQYGRTALMYAAGRGRLKMVTLLLGSGVNYDLKDLKGQTAYDLVNKKYKRIRVELIRVWRRGILLQLEDHLPRDIATIVYTLQTTRRLELCPTTG